MKPKPTTSQRLRDLPGWKEASEWALRARLRMPAGHFIDLVGANAIADAGLFAAPPSVQHVSRELILCIAIGMKSQHADMKLARKYLRKLPSQPDNVVSLRDARLAKLRKESLYSFAGDDALQVMLGEAVTRDDEVTL